MNCHCVFCKTDLRYDGRVCAEIKTLALAFPNEAVNIYNLIDYDIDVEFEPNVKYVRYKALVGFFPKKHIVQILKSIEFAFFAFSILLFKHVKSIQIHHEPIILGPLVYKLLFPKVLLVYDDKELYHYKEYNIPKILFDIEALLIRKSDLVIFANKYRYRATKLMHKKNLNHLIIENFIFDVNGEPLNEEILLKIHEMKDANIKIFLHQGALASNRGIDKIVNIVELLPDNWKFAFIGISKNDYENLCEVVPEPFCHKMCYMGYVPYKQLNKFWSLVDGTLIVYDDSTFNNKYSAPNRLFTAANNGVPIIVNEENVTLLDFISKYKTGVVIPPMSNINNFFINYDEYKGRAKKYLGCFEYKNGVLLSLQMFYSDLKK